MQQMGLRPGDTASWSCSSAVWSTASASCSLGVLRHLHCLLQLDRAERGFSFTRPGPLDMRMGPSATLTAEQLVNTWPEGELGRIIREYGEERHWRGIASR